MARMKVPLRAFGFIDRRAREHRIATLSDLGVFYQLQQRRAGIGVNIGLCVVKQHVLRAEREILGAVWVIEQRGYLAVRHGVLPLLKVLPKKCP